MIPKDIPGPFTPARLLDLAIETDDALLKQQALACGAWMEKQGIAELPYVGPFGLLPKVRKVRIPKGTRFWTTHPSASQAVGGDNHKVAGRTYEVDVHRVSEGWVDTWVRDGVLHQPTVTWAGAGGYWCEVPLTAVEILD